MQEEERICSICGEVHAVDEMELSFRRPDAVCELAVTAREECCQENDDLCIIQAQRYFVRGVLALPVAGHPQPYRLGIWVEVAPEDYRRILELWDDPYQADEIPFAVRIANHIPTLAQTHGIAASLQLSCPTTRLDILVSDPLHQLYEEHFNGISVARIDHYNHLY